MPQEDDQPADYHDKADVLDALAKLTRLEVTNLQQFARFRSLRFRGRSNDADEEDLVNEAITKTLELKRRWRNDVPFVAHLAGCINSIADNWAKKAARFRQLPDDQPSPFFDPDSELDTFAALRRLEQCIGHDPEMMAVLDHIFGEKRLADILEFFQMSGQKYPSSKVSTAPEALKMAAHKYRAARARLRRYWRKMLLEDAARWEKTYGRVEKGLSAAASHSPTSGKIKGEPTCG